MSCDKGEVFVQRKQCKVKVVTSGNDREQILKACHSEPISGHFGLTKTWKRIAERFLLEGDSQRRKAAGKYYEVFFANVLFHTSLMLTGTNCSECQKMNKKLERGRPELHPIAVKSPWHHLGMDFIGPISHTSEAGNCYILTVSDYFTKFAWAKALPTKEAARVVSGLKEVRGVLFVSCGVFMW